MRRKLARVVAELALMLFLLGLAPTAVAMEWSPPEHVGSSDDDGNGSVALASNSNGFAAAVWDDGGRLEVATALPGRRFRAPRVVPRSRLSDFELPELTVDMDERGNTLLAWEYDDNTREPSADDDDEGCCTGIRFTVLRRTGRFDPVRTLAPRGTPVQLGAVEIAAGRVALAFTERSGGSHAPREGALVYTQSRSGDGSRTDVADAAASDVHAVAIVRGLPRVIYRRSAGDTALVEAVADETYAFGEPAVVAPDVETVPAPRIATGAAGRQALVYSKEEQLDVDRIYAGTRSAGAPFEIRAVSRPGQGSAITPDVAVAGGGAAFIGWVGPLQAPTVYGAIAPTGQRFSGPRAIAGRNRGTLPEVLADVNSRGTGVVAWERDSDQTVRVGFVTPNAKPRAHTVLASRRAARPLTIDPPKVAIDDHQRVLVIYVVGNRVLARRATAPMR